MVDWPCKTSSRTPWLPPKAPWVQMSANWCPESLIGALEIAASSTVVSFCQETWRQFLGHQLDFQGTSWQICGPRGPNTMSTFMPVAGHWEGLGRQPSCP